MKKIIPLIIIGILLISTVFAISKLTEKPTKTEDLSKTNITNKDQDALSDYYQRKFENVMHFNNYKNDKNIVILNVTLNDGSYARIITKNDTFSELLK